MNIKEFLMNNYIYIVIIIILVIVTIIGFLTDKQKIKKERGMAIPTPNNYGAEIPAQPIVYQPVVAPTAPTVAMNQMPVNNMMPNNQINVAPVVPNNVVTPVPNDMSYVQPNPMINNVMNTPQPVEPMNIVAQPAPEPIYQPLSEQRPHIEPVNPINNAMNYGTEQINPQVMAQPMNAPMPNGFATPSNQGMGSIPPMEPTPVGGFAPEPVNMAIPTAINNGMQAPTPMNPQPIPTPPVNVAPSPIIQPQPTVPQPIGFVYGPQTQNPNNNQPM